MNLLNYKDFTKAIKNEISHYFNDDTIISITSIIKNNDQKFDGLIFTKKGSNISPTIYLNPLYEEYKKGNTIKEIAEKIKHSYDNADAPSFSKEASQFTNYEFVKKRLAIKLINFEANKELLKDTPHVRKLDLAIVFLCLIEKQSKQNASIMIKNTHLKYWNISIDTLYYDALYNSPQILPFRCYSLMSTVQTKDNAKPLDIDNISLAKDDMLILTNDVKINGAATILYPEILDKIATNLNKNLFIIPSSIHEVLILPENKYITGNDLNSLVKTVNTQELNAGDVLSDSIYIYNLSDKIITK